MATLIRRYAEDRLAWAHSDIIKARLDPFTAAVYLQLSARADKDGRSFPKQETLADDAGMSVRQVIRCVQVLIDRKLLVTRQESGSKGGKRTIYYLVRRSEWLSSQVGECDSQSLSKPSNVTHTTEQCDSQSLSQYKELNPKELNPKRVFEVPSKDKTTKAKKATDPKKFLAEFPAEFRQDDGFVEAWANWGEMRNDLKKPLTERAAKIAMKALVVCTVADAIKALDRSTLSGWSGVFPESLGKGGGSGKFGQASSAQPKQNFGF